ncbi:hypothetical protein ALC152_17920 [Arcobacter sp. 15-2]|uniref:7TM diverse intracellular signaling domain-containing protein n=1 Tax=Arcobacter sp. 15-2 TaxID=3374109 RepID=UPI00399CCCA9
MKKIFFIFLLFTNIVYGQSISVNHIENIYDDFEVAYYNDQNSSLSIKEISQKNFTETTTNKFALGYKKGTIWYKFSISNNANTTNFILSLNEHFYEKANLYHYEKGWIKKSNSVFTPLSQREIKNSKLSFSLNQKTNTTQTYYLELKGKYAYFGDITLYEKESFYFDKQIDSNTLYLILFGILIIIIIFNLFLYLKIKEKMYLYYVGYSFFNLVFVINISGLLAYLNLQYYLYDLQFSAAFMVGFLILFSQEYLEIRKHYILMDKLLKILTFVFFVIGFLVIYSYQPWNKVINNLSGVVTILLIILAILVCFKQHQKTKLYLLAISIFFTFVIFFTFMVSGILEYSFLTRYGFVIALVFEATIFSLMLANRYHNLKETNELYLEIEIKKQTNDLVSLNKKLKSLVQERELLLKEVLHRVKNNFHIIIGILWFQKNKVQDKTIFNELINKIKSMSKINEYLYKSENINEVNTIEYLNEVIELAASFDTEKITLNTNMENLTIKFHDAMSLGIIINELITNSIKHNQHLKKIDIQVNLSKKAGVLKLELKDNGHAFDMKNSEGGIGLLLIEEFCGKLKESEYRFTFEQGNIFLLRFKYNEI